MKITSRIARGFRRVAIAGALGVGLSLGVAAPALAVTSAPVVVQDLGPVAAIAAPAPVVLPSLVDEDAPPAPEGDTLIDVIIGAITGHAKFTWVDLVQVLILPLLPSIVGLVNRLTNWPSLLKWAALGVLAVASQVLPDAVQAANGGTAFDWLRAVLSAGVAWYLAQKAYDKVYKAPLDNGGRHAARAEDTAPPVTLASKIAGR